jgi:hypothetical protein
MKKLRKKFKSSYGWGGYLKWFKFKHRPARS